VRRDVGAVGLEPLQVHPETGSVDGHDLSSPLTQPRSPA
jgi:hypothetical protein